MRPKPTSPESDLALLLKQGTDYAESAMHKLGHVPPALFALTPQGGLQFVPSSLEDERAKNEFANTARLVCAGYEARAALLVSARWRILACDEFSLVSEVETTWVNKQPLWHVHFLSENCYWVTVDLDWGFIYREFFVKTGGAQLTDAT